jgi:polyhydroxyalkanoate synthesis regulator phasin
MLDLLKKTAYAGLGLAFMTQEKVRDVARDLSQKAKLREEEGRRFADELNEKAKEARDQFESRVTTAVECAMGKMRIPTTDHLAAIEARLAAVEEALKGKDDKPASDA